MSHNRASQYILTPEHGIRPEPDQLKYAAWRASIDGTDFRAVARTKVGDTEVSTVFVGLDWNRSPHGAPLVFETMVFGGPMDGQVDRYGTREGAETGHREIVERVMAAEAKEANR